MGVVDAVAVDTVIEAKADCADRARAEAAITASLAAARAPRRSTDADARWQLEMTISAAAPGIKVADARIRDDRGQVVAERSLSDKTASSCLALAGAVSAWAQVVLDDELVRAHDVADHEAIDPQTPVLVTERLAAPSEPDIAESRSPKPAGRTIEVGTVLFFRNGAASTSGIFGTSPFLTFGLSETWLLRPSLAIGTSTSRVPPDQSNSNNLTYAGGRVDVCKRMPGNYIDRRGIELDVCAGSDAAYVWSKVDAHTRWSVGPSAVLRGELGQNFGLELRTLVGANLLRDGNAPPFVVSGELGGSVRFR